MSQFLQLELEGTTPEIAGLIQLACSAHDMSEGLGRAEHAHQQAGATANHRDQAYAGYVYCYFLYRSGALERVLAVSKQTLPMLKLEGLLELYANLLRWVGLSACDAGRFAEAMQYAIECYEMADQTNDARARVLALSLLASSFERSGDPWQAERLLRDGVQLARQLGETYPLVSSLNNLAATLIGLFYRLRDRASADEARAALVKALPLAREFYQLAPGMQEPQFSVIAQGNLGEILVHLGHYDEAEVYLNRALKQAQEKRYDASASRIRCSIGELHLARGEVEQALELTALLLLEPVTPVSTRMQLHYTRYLANKQRADSHQALLELERYRQLESRISLQQLKARSDLMVTRIEADGDRRRSLERAYKMAQVHASRSIELERMALQDELTGLANRRAFDLRLADLMAEAQETQTVLTVIVFDIDHFKQVNDRFGHAVGDRALVQLAQLLSAQARPEDLLARTGGEELVLVLPGLDSKAGYDICERLQQALADHAWEHIAPGLALTLCAGIASTPPYNVTELCERADLAMYKAKRAGRNRIVFAEPDSLQPML